MFSHLNILPKFEKKLRAKRSCVFELKIKRGESSYAKGLEQTPEYGDICGAREAHLLIFDRNPERTWDEKIRTKSSRSFRKKFTSGHCKLHSGRNPLFSTILSVILKKTVRSSYGQNRICAH